jgi:2-deoxy-D-gluconate 3-dehydrogenase
MNPFDLTGRLAVVTGAKRGIGFAMAEALATAGADIIGVSATIEPEGSAIEKRVTSLGRTFRAIRADFNDTAQVAELAETLAAEPVDILVNNAGTIRRAPAAEHSDAYWDEVLQVNLTSQFALTRAVGRSMLERGGGKVIFTASLLSFQGGINVPGYAAAKSGIAGLTRALAMELAPHKITVNTIVPSMLARQDRSHDIPKHPVYRPLLGRAGWPDDVAPLARLLVGPGGRYITGQIINVSGGTYFNV